MVSQVPRQPADLLRLFEGVSSASASGDLRVLGFNINTVYARGIHTVVPGVRLVGRAVTIRYVPARDEHLRKEREHHPPSEEVLRQFRERHSAGDRAAP